MSVHHHYHQSSVWFILEAHMHNMQCLTNKINVGHVLIYKLRGSRHHDVKDHNKK